MTVRLRAHHLLCLLTYAGKGYGPAFTANYDRIADRIGAGEEIEIVAGPDDICAPLLNDPEAHCRRDSVVERDALAARAVGDLLGRPIAAGDRLDMPAERARRMRMGFSDGTLRAACAGCQWHGLCSEIAEAGYRGTRLVDPAPDR